MAGSNFGEGEEKAILIRHARVWLDFLNKAIDLHYVRDVLNLPNFVINYFQFDWNRMNCILISSILSS